MPLTKLTTVFPELAPADSGMVSLYELKHRLVPHTGQDYLERNIVKEVPINPGFEDSFDVRECIRTERLKIETFGVSIAKEIGEKPEHLRDTLLVNTKNRCVFEHHYFNLCVDDKVRELASLLTQEEFNKILRSKKEVQDSHDYLKGKIVRYCSLPWYKRIFTLP